MALATYNDLLAAVAAWVARDNLTANIPDFVTLFEAEANRRLRVRQMEASINSLVFSNTPATAILPSDYLMWRTVWWIGNPRRVIEYVHPSYFTAAFPDSPTDIPRYFTIIGGVIAINPTDTTSNRILFDYFQKIGPLSSSVNWLYSAHPDIYLFGTLAEAYGFQKDANNMAMWAARRDDIFDKIERLDQKTRGPSQVHIMGWTP